MIRRRKKLLFEVSMLFIRVMNIIYMRWNNIRASLGPLETVALRDGLEGLHNVLTVVLVHEDQGHLVLLEWPPERTIFSPHQDKREREVGAMTEPSPLRHARTHIL